MKKFFLAAFLVTASTALVVITPQQTHARSHGGGSAVKVPASSVPKEVLQAFKSRFAGVSKVEWEYQAVYYGTPIYEVSFYQNGKRWKATFNAGGVFLGASPK